MTARRGRSRRDPRPHRPWTRPIRTPPGSAAPRSGATPSPRRRWPPWPRRSIATTRRRAREPRCRRSGTGSTSCRWPRQSEIGADGHPRRGGFLPPVRAAAPHVGGRAALVPAAAARRRRDDADVADREHRQQAGALRAARLRHRRARDRDGGRRRPARGARHRLPRHAGAGRDRDPRGRADRRDVRAQDRPRRRAALPLFGADLQRPSHPLRPALRHRGRGLSGPDRARPADRHAARRPAAPRASRRGRAPLRVQGAQPALRPASVHRLRPPRRRQALRALGAQRRGRRWRCRRRPRSPDRSRARERHAQVRARSLPGHPRRRARALRRLPRRVPPRHRRAARAIPRSSSTRSPRPAGWRR